MYLGVQSFLPLVLRTVGERKYKQVILPTSEKTLSVHRFFHESLKKYFVFQLAAPSPTVNTKNAMNVVMGMFNQSLYQGQDTWGQNQVNNEDEFLEAQFAATDSDCEYK